MGSDRWHLGDWKVWQFDFSSVWRCLLKKTQFGVFKDTWVVEGVLRFMDIKISPNLSMKRETASISRVNALHSKGFRESFLRTDWVKIQISKTIGIKTKKKTDVKISQRSNLLQVSILKWTQSKSFTENQAKYPPCPRKYQNPAFKFILSVSTLAIELFITKKIELNYSNVIKCKCTTAMIVTWNNQKNEN